MGFDGQLKRLFPLLLCALIALAAYLQAAGIGQLVASTVAGDGAAPAPPAMQGGPVGPSKTRSGAAILARNPFDSVTGPLDGSAVEISEDPVATDGAGGGEVSGEDPACGFGRVVLISASPDPEWSFAAIEDDTGESKLRRRGDEVSGHTIQALGWDRVWLSDGGKRCQMKLGSGAKAPKKSAARKPRRSRRKSRALPAEMAAKITKVSATEYNIERSMVDEILENQAELMRSARIVPEKSGDQVVGIRLFGIRKGSLLSHLGMINGDRLESINGFNMSDPQKALEAYGRLRTANALKVKINRKGKPMNLDFNIQ